MKDEIDKKLLPSRIIVGAMAAGMTMFGVIAAVLGPLGSRDGLNVYLVVLGGIAMGEAIAYRFLRDMRLNNLRARAPEWRAAPDPSAALIPEYHQLLVIRSGFCEGAGLFALVLYLLTGSILCLGYAVVALLLLVSGFPTRDALRDFTREVTGSA